MAMASHLIIISSSSSSSFPHPCLHESHPSTSSSSSSSSLPSFPTRRPSTSPAAPLRLSLPKVSLQDTPLPLKNSIWINPNSPRASRLRHHYSDSRHARLLQLSNSLNSSLPSAVADLLAALPEPPSEQDAVVMLDNMDNPDAALSALRWFLSNINLNKDTILYNVTFKVLRKRKDWQKVEALWAEMLDNGVRPDNVTFSTVISCARLCNLPGKAVEWFERMEEFRCSPDDVSYSAMIDAYGRSGNVAMALELYDKARREKWRLDPVTFATVIRVYSASGDFDGALNVFEEMKAIGVKPNVVIYNTLLDAMGRAARPWQVKALFREMSANGLLPNRATHAALVRAYSKARYAEDALNSYKEMKEKGFELNVILYNMLLSMCADLGYVDQAVSIFEEMKELPDGSKPDSWSYSSLITVYSCSGQVLEAERVLNEMMEAGFQPNIIVLTSIIQCYGKARQTDDIVRTFSIVLESGITPDDRFCGCLLNVMTQIPTEELGKIIGCIEKASEKLGSLVKLLVDRGTANEVIRQEAEDLFSMTSEEVKKAYCNCLIDLCVNLDLLERACILLDMAVRLEIYTCLQSKSATQWSLHVRSLSLGAALTALHVWMNDLTKALEGGEELPPLLGIHTGHGKHKYSDRGLAGVFESHLRELNAPFHEAPDKVGWFLTTKVAAESWLKSRTSPELVAA